MNQLVYKITCSSKRILIGLGHDPRTFDWLMDFMQAFDWMSLGSCVLECLGRIGLQMLHVQKCFDSDDKSTSVQEIEVHSHAFLALY
mmetsp:Transcript_12851/g.23114  ORF Transcript_12851/g.23114 Transcript_12851/m.23114 type:complete len:87 (-) Transcript_12851:703-963(-)